jgi:gliding motility-associated-like protein
VRKIVFTYLLLLFLLPVAAQKYNLLPDTVTLCEGDTASIEIRQEVPQTSIRWNTPEGVITNTKRIRANRQGAYFIRIGTQQGAVMADSTFIKIFQRPVARLGDTVLCRGKGALTLDAGNTGMRYSWSTGESTQRIKVINPGRYWVKINNGKCVVTDSLRVRSWPPNAGSVPTETTFCLAEENKILTARATGLRILWNTGALTPTVNVSREGTYWVRMEDRSCGAYTDTIRVKFKACDCEMIIPNSFTPNEDNRNDHFFPVLQCDYTYFNMTITDRWGNNVYSSNNAAGKWDGRYKGNLCPEDIYVYRIESTQKGSDRKQVRNGQISLFR